jgi:hypothetical protein
MLIRIVALVFLLASPLVSAETTKSLSTGFDFSSGKYGGTTSTNILSIPVTGKIRFDDYFFKLTVPYIRVSSTGGVVTQKLGPNKSVSKSTIVTQSGLGDITASAGYTFYEAERLALDLVGNVKFGTANPEQNLGSGKNDYSAQIDGTYGINSTSVFATAGYKIVGAPEGMSVRNIAYATVGASQKLNDISSVGAALDAAQSSSELSSGTREFSVFYSRKINKTEKVSVYILKGFTDSSPDFGFGASITGTF